MGRRADLFCRNPARSVVLLLLTSKGNLTNTLTLELVEVRCLYLPLTKRLLAFILLRLDGENHRRVCLSSITLPRGKTADEVDEVTEGEPLLNTSELDI